MPYIERDESGAIIGRYNLPQDNAAEWIDDDMEAALAQLRGALVAQAKLQGEKQVYIPYPITKQLNIRANGPHQDLDACIAAHKIAYQAHKDAINSADLSALQSYDVTKGWPERWGDITPDDWTDPGYPVEASNDPTPDPDSASDDVDSGSADEPVDSFVYGDSDDSAGGDADPAAGEDVGGDEQLLASPGLMITGDPLTAAKALLSWRVDAAEQDRLSEYDEASIIEELNALRNRAMGAREYDWPALTDEENEKLQALETYAGHIAQVQAHARELRAMIRNAPDEATLGLIDIEAGWP